MSARKQQRAAEGIYRRTSARGKVTYRAISPGWIDGTGRRHQPSKSLDTLKEAKAWRAEQATRQSQGMRPTSGGLTLAAYLTNWTAGLGSRMASNTAAQYRAALTRLAALPIGRRRLTDLDTLAVNEAYRLLPATSIRYVHTALHRALAELVPGVLPRNPAAGAERPKIDREERPVWSEDEMRAFLDTAAGDRLAALWRTLALSGLRRGELLGLRWVDVDLPGGFLAVRQQHTIEGGRAVVKILKTKASRREVDLDAGTVAALRAWKAQQTADRLAAGPLWKDSGFVFTHQDGAAIAPSRAFDDRFRAIVAGAGVRRLTVHDVRHTHATLLLRRGVPVHVVSRRLGHANIGVTLGIYAHVLPDMSRAAAAAAGAIAEGM